MIADSSYALLHVSLGKVLKCALRVLGSQPVLVGQGERDRAEGAVVRASKNAAVHSI